MSNHDCKVNLARIQELLSYDPVTGIFIWKKTTSNRVKVGSQAGCVSSERGYVLIRIDGILMQASRVAMRMMGENIDGLHVDHIDGNCTNNQFVNLRPVTRHQNMRNSRKRESTFTSRWKGVSKCTRGNKWVARIYVNGKNIVLGRFSDEREAAEEYMFAAIEHFGEYARLQ